MSRVEIIGAATLYLGDCRDILPTLGGGVDAVVTDPPYGIGEAAGKAKTRKPGAGAISPKSYVRDYGDDDWDSAPPSADLIAMVLAAGRWKIIFGGNYLALDAHDQAGAALLAGLPPSSCWLVWDKLNGDTDFADCELAWTNLPQAVRRIRYLWNGMLRANKEPRGDHPTQKPVGVMKWALSQLPQGSRTILDPFMGSGTTGVACAELGLTFTGIEREVRYFDAACRRIASASRQPGLFEAGPKPVQPSIFGEAP